MSVYVPPAVAESLLSHALQAHLALLHRGKVRDTYALPDHPDKLLVVATDRISIFDFVLGKLVPHKGEVLTALTIFWFTRLFTDVEHHLVAFGNGIDDYLPEAARGDTELSRRALVVEKLTMLPVECIARGYLTGSGLGAYQKSQSVCGIPLPEGLHDGSKLPKSIFTPTTKAEEGHDEHITAESVDREFGTWLGVATLDLYERAQAYAKPRGIIIADTKFEFGNKLADEVLTPDSSRFWDAAEYEQAQKEGRSPAGYDKEPVRQAGKVALIDGRLVNISRLNPKNFNEVLFAANWDVPDEVIDATTARYLTIVERLTGFTLAEFQEEMMGCEQEP